MTAGRLPCLALLALALAGGAAAGPARLRVVASGLENPRKLFVAPDGTLYVVEAGRGGSRCLATCAGPTGAISRIAEGRRTRVVTGLPSVANRDGGTAEGASAVWVGDGSFDVLLQGTMAGGAGGADPLGPAAAHLVATPPGRAELVPLVDFAAFEDAHDPDRGAGPGARYGQPPLDSDPYALVSYRDGFVVADAGANDLLEVGPTGTVSVLAVFPTQRERLTRREARELGAPRLAALDVQSVPTSVAVGPDGALYVGELTGWPYRPGRARVWRVVPGRPPAVYASGFTTISDLAFDGRSLLVLELTAGGADTGALVRVAPDGTRTVLARAGLVRPTGVAVDRGTIYLSNHGTSPHGEVVALRAP